MDKLLMLGTSNLSVEIIQLAKARGVYTITTDYLEPRQSAAKLVSDEYWMISTGDLDALEKKCREEGITAVITGVSEFNAESMMDLCGRLGLPCWCTTEAWEAVQRKHNFKRHCRENNVPVATDYFLSNPPTEEELEGIVFPVVVKPVDQGGNEGMSYCYTKEDVVKGCAYARSKSDNENLIVERMLHGREYTAYYALAEGEASLLSLLPEYSQPGYPANCYSFMTTATDKLLYYVENVEPQVKQMLKAAGCREGICWIQLFLDEDGQFYAIEMGYRLSGEMISLAQRDAYGFDSLGWLLDIALGKKHRVQDLPVSFTYDGTRCACSYILWSKSAGIVDHFVGIEEISKIPGLHLRKIVPEGKRFNQYQYLIVFVFAVENYQDMFERIETINQTVKILDQDGKNAVIYFDDFDTVRKIAEEALQEG